MEDVFVIIKLVYQLDHSFSNELSNDDCTMRRFIIKIKPSAKSIFCVTKSRFLSCFAIGMVCSFVRWLLQSEKLLIPLKLFCSSLISAHKEEEEEICRSTLNTKKLLVV